MKETDRGPKHFHLGGFRGGVGFCGSLESVWNTATGSLKSEELLFKEIRDLYFFEIDVSIVKS